MMNNQTSYCDSCKTNKKAVIKKKLLYSFGNFCPECLEDLGWTNASLISGTNKLLDKFPERYDKLTQISVLVL